MRTPIRTCKVCGGRVVGRTDKIYCSANCKAIYHAELKRKTKLATTAVDKILHRNRSTLYELMGDHKRQIKVSRLALDRKKFNYDYFTGLHMNSRGKLYHHVYDFSWMIFSDQEVLIVRRELMR